MRHGRWIVAAAVLVAGCDGDGDGQRITFDQLTDLEQELPEDATGIELEEAAPPDDVTFCDAAGTAPARWLTDALFPMQYWVDSFGAIDDLPEPAAESVAALVEFGQRRLRWSLGSGDERPEWTAEMAEHAIVVFDVALERCDDLPTVVGLPGTSDRPAGWDDLTDAEVAERCAGFADDVAEGIAWYAAETGAPPRHQQQIELVNDLAWRRVIEETGELPDDVPLYTASSWIGVGPDGAPAPVPGGACER